MPTEVTPLTLLLPGWLEPRDAEVRAIVRKDLRIVYHWPYEQPIEIWPETLERCARLAAEL